MDTIKKIWYALNHAGKPWQISLSLALGMVVGFTPIISVHNLIIFILVLLLNIHIGIFLLAVSFFGIFGLMLDPLFASLGTAVLTLDSLQSIFTHWYNTPFGNISGFNNTILMGSLIVSLLLFIIVFKVSSILLMKYRDIIAVKIANIPILNKLQFFKKEDKKEIKTFRLVGIAIIAFIIGSISIFKILIFDEIVKSNIEIAINKSSNKIVEIENLSTSFLTSSVNLSNIVIQDKDDKNNNINIKNIILDINLSELIFKRVIVENLKIEKINFPSTTNNNVTIQKTVQPSAQSTTKSFQKKNKTKQTIDNLSSLNNMNTSDIQKGFEEDYKKEFDKFKGYYNQIKPLFNKTKESETEVTKNRNEGKFVYFNLNNVLPKLLIKDGTFSVEKGEDTISGTFKDFTTNQFLYKKPFKLYINTKTKNFKSLVIKLSLLETKEISLDTLAVTIKELNIKPITRKDIKIINTKIDTTLDLEIKDKKHLKGYERIDVLSSDIVFNETNKYVKTLNKSLISTKGIVGTVIISGDINNPKLQVSSNLDKVLEYKIKTVLNLEQENIQKELTEKVKSKVEKKLKKFLGF